LNRVDVPAAVDAFLRGIERRAYLFLWLQGGRPEAAEPALAAGLRAFAAQAAAGPMAEWPDRFWRLLAALPVREDGHWPAPLGYLGTLGSEPRRALLLRMAAGLDERAAAEALGVSLATYRDRLAVACPRDASGEADVAAWHRIAQAVQQAGRDLAPPQLVRLARLREAALAGRPVPAPAPPPRADATSARALRRRWPWILLVVLACAAALAATWWLEPRLAGDGSAATGTAEAGHGDGDLRVHDRGPILVEPLPETSAPAAEAMPVPLPEPPADPAVASLDLYAWYAAGAPDSAMEREAEGAPPPPPAAALPAPPPAQAELLWAAWEALDATEQAQVRAAAEAFRALPPSEQAALRARFAALDAMERHGWLLGPALGADWPALQPLFGYVTEGEREPLLDALRALAPHQRAQLTALSRRTPPQQRAALRLELLAQPPAQRADWLARRHAD